jgi:hypothetical protein
MMTTRELLGEYAHLLSKFGDDSKQAKDFLESHRYDQEFLELAQLSRKLKKALTAPAANHAADYN